MKISIVTTLLICFFINIATAQNDYYKLKIKGGSTIFGQLLEENNKQYRLLTNDLDTLTITKRIIRSSYLIPGTLKQGDVVPIFQKGIFYEINGSLGYGAVAHFRELHIASLSTLMAYQFNSTFSLGVGLRGFGYDEHYSRHYYRRDFMLIPYVQTRFNYRKTDWKKVGLHFMLEGIYIEDLTADATSVIGITIFRPRCSYLFGIGYRNDLYNGFYDFSARFGIQL